MMHQKWLLAWLHLSGSSLLLLPPDSTCFTFIHMMRMLLHQNVVLSMGNLASHAHCTAAPLNSHLLGHAALKMIQLVLPLMFI